VLILSFISYCCVPSANLTCRSEMCWKCTTQKTPKIRHLGTIAQLCRAISSQLRHLLTIEKNSLNSSISSTCPHNMVNFGLLTAEICWRVWGTPANFNWFRVLASLLQRSRSMKVNQTLHDVWPSSGLAHYVYIFRGSCPVTEFCHVQNSLCVLLYWQRYCTTLEQRASAKVCGVVQERRTFRRGRHLYSAGRTSRCASAHILVIS